MLNPFRLFGRLLFASLKVVAFTFVFLIQVGIFLLHRRSDKIGEAVGWYGKEVVETYATAFQR